MMKTEEIFNQMKAKLELNIKFLEDKPEETIDSTLKACWFAAFGEPKSATEAIKYPLPDISDEQIKDLNYLVEMRLNNTPLAHITGRQNFMGIEYLSDNRALIPRKETEILGIKALELVKKLAQEKENVNVMDICCGSGNLGLSMAYYNQKCFVSASDLSHGAVELTKDNTSFLNLQQRVMVKQGDLFSAFFNDNYFGNVDLIICNPPYISSAKVPKMHEEISSYEPVMAFDGGMFGTKIIQKLIIESPQYLVSGGWVILEVGLGQGDFIKGIFDNSNVFGQIEAIGDDSGRTRVVMARKN